MKMGIVFGMILSTCLTSLDLSAQTGSVSVPIVDSTLIESPLRVSGKVFFENQVASDTVMVRYTLDAWVTNSSGRSIISYEVTFGLSPEYGPGTGSAYTDDR